MTSRRNQIVNRRKSVARSFDCPGHGRLISNRNKAGELKQRLLQFCPGSVLILATISPPFGLLPNMVVTQVGLLTLATEFRGRSSSQKLSSDQPRQGQWQPECGPKGSNPRPSRTHSPDQTSWPHALMHEIVPLRLPLGCRTWFHAWRHARDPIIKPCGILLDIFGLVMLR